MPKIHLIANWKMQLNKSNSVRLSVEVAKEVEKTKNENLQVILCPTFTAISDVARKIKNTKIGLGAQNVFYHEKGAYTGEVSPAQLKELGVEYVIVGHSERRKYLKETDEEVNRKVNVCLDNGLVPIICVGENFDQRRLGKTDLALTRQVDAAIQDVVLAKNQKLLIAYEPVWVIGSGQAVEPAEAEHAAQVIKYVLRDFFEERVIEENISIIYGGSVDKNNVRGFIKLGLLDGILVGGASLSIEKFLPIINIFKSRI